MSFLLRLHSRASQGEDGYLRDPAYLAYLRSTLEAHNGNSRMIKSFGDGRF